MRCPNCGFEYFNPETIERGVCPACGGSLTAKVSDLPLPEHENMTPATVSQLEAVNKKLDEIASGVNFLVIVVIILIILWIFSVILGLAAW